MAKSKIEKKVKVTIPRVSKDQPDEVVWVGHTRYQIRPGVSVEVPESVAAALMDAEYMKNASYNFEQANLL